MGYMSAHDPRVHFGLGQRKAIESLEITWLSGTVDRLANVPVNQIITVKEGAGIVPGEFPKVTQKQRARLKPLGQAPGFQPGN